MISLMAAQLPRYGRLLNIYRKSSTAGPREITSIRIDPGKYSLPSSVILKIYSGLARRGDLIHIEIAFRTYSPQSILLAKIQLRLHDRVTSRLHSYLYVKFKYMNVIQLLGLFAGSLTTAAFLPQVIKTWKSRSAKDLSLGMFSLFCLGVALWLVYGFAVNDVPVIAANLLTLLLASTLLFFKLRFRQ